MHSELVGKGTTAWLAVIGVCGAADWSPFEPGTGVRNGSIVLPVSQTASSSFGHEWWGPAWDLWLQWLLERVACGRPADGSPNKVAMRMAIDCYWAHGLIVPNSPAEREELREGLWKIRELGATSPPGDVEPWLLAEFNRVIDRAIAEVENAK